MILPVFLGIAILCGIIYLAVSRRSSRMVRISAVGALGLMILSVIVCLLVFFKSAGAKPLILPDTLPEDIPPPSGQSTTMLVMFIVFLVALFAAVLVVALRGQEQDRKDNW